MFDSLTRGFVTAPSLTVGLLTRSAYCSLTRTSIFHLHNFRFAGSIDGYDVKIVVLVFRDGRICRPTERRDDFRHGVVVTRDENSLATIVGTNPSQQLASVFRIHLIYRQT